MNITLLGDSIFDNKSYVGSGPDVITHLRGQLPDDATAKLCAVDGDIASDVAGQLHRVPADATHLFVSVGGNDALHNAHILQMPASSSAEVFSALADITDTFENRYQAMLQAVLKLNKPTTVCTIYYPLMEDPLFQKLSVAGLASFNDVIIKHAFRAGLPLIDLRLLCNEAADYANEIEPSVQGGEKIARTILRIANQHDWTQKGTRVYF